MRGTSLLLQVYRRYLKLEPTHAEEFVAYLRIKELWGEAARVSSSSRRRRRAEQQQQQQLQQPPPQLRIPTPLRSPHLTRLLTPPLWLTLPPVLCCPLLLPPPYPPAAPPCPLPLTPSPPRCTPVLLQRLADVVDDESFRSLEGKSKHQLWLELCDLVTKHPDEVKVLRGGG